MTADPHAARAAGVGDGPHDLAITGGLHDDVSNRGAARGTPFDLVLDQMADGVIIADVAGRVWWANSVADRMHGRVMTDRLPENSSHGYAVLRVDGTPYPQGELPLTRTLARGDAVEGEEWVVRRPDGTHVHVLGSAAPLCDGLGRRIGAVLVTRDVTERTRLLQAIRAETSAKERFFAHLSHELRTPVNAVLGYTSLLSGGDAGTLPSSAAQMVGRIAGSARHLRDLVDDLLDLTRIAAGEVSLAIEEVPLAALVRDTVASLEPQARAKGLALECRTPEIPRVRTDARRVRQVLLNLLSNAVKFTERGGVTVAIEPHLPQNVAVHVVDTGDGIAAADQERVFGEFVQLGAARGGTGLGLAISRRLARVLGGDLTLRSAPDRGSCFTLTLPLTLPVAESPAGRAHGGQTP